MSDVRDALFPHGWVKAQAQCIFPVVDADHGQPDDPLLVEDGLPWTEHGWGYHIRSGDVVPPGGRSGILPRRCGHDLWRACS
jgi:hypothetical protein